MGIFIEDGQTRTKQLAEKPGHYPAVTVVYRPALARKRHEYSQKFNQGDAAKIDAWESELVESHVVTLDGDKIPKGRAEKLVPELRKAIIDLILSYESADEEADLKN